MSTIQEKKEKIKSEISCVDYLNSEGYAARYKGNICCPFHDDDKPSMTVYDDHVFCHAGCDRKDIIDLAQEFHGLNYGEAVNYLWDNYMEKKTAMEKKIKFTANNPHEYMEKRGFDRAFVDGLIEQKKMIINGDLMRFPAIDNDGKSYGTTWINYRSGERGNDPGCRVKDASFLIGEGEITVIVEGVMDALSVYSVVPGVRVMAILGAGNTDKCASISGDKIWCLDNDKAGRSAVDKICQGDEFQNDLVVDWSGIEEKDANELLSGGKIDELKRLIMDSGVKVSEYNNRESTDGGFKIFGVNEFLDIEIPEPVFYFDWLKKGSINHIYSESGVGKTRFCLSMCFSIAAGRHFAEWEVRNRGKILYVDSEMERGDMLEIFRTFRNYRESEGNFFYLPLVTEDDVGIPPFVNNPAFQAFIENAVDDMGIDVLVIDNLMTMADGVDFNDLASYSPLNNWFKHLRNNKNLTVLLLDHENKSKGYYGTVGKSLIANNQLQLVKHGEMNVCQFEIISKKDRMARFGGNVELRLEKGDDHMLGFEATNGKADYERRRKGIIATLLVRGYSQKDIGQMLPNYGFPTIEKSGMSKAVAKLGALVKSNGTTWEWTPAGKSTCHEEIDAVEANLKETFWKPVGNRKRDKPYV